LFLFLFLFIYLFIFFLNVQSFPGVCNKVRPTSGFALFAYQVLNSSEVIHFLPINGGNNCLAEGEESAKEVSPNHNKLADHSNSQAAKVFHMKGGGNTNTTSSEVRRPVGICMNVMSTVFCRKVLASYHYSYFLLVFFVTFVNSFLRTLVAQLNGSG
jgi:hypothetical protein